MEEEANARAEEARLAEEARAQEVRFARLSELRDAWRLQLWISAEGRRMPSSAESRYSLKLRQLQRSRTTLLEGLPTMLLATFGHLSWGEAQLFERRLCHIGPQLPPLAEPVP